MHVRFVSRTRELIFGAPDRFFCATRICEVIPCIEQTVRAVAEERLSAAGFIAYEAAGAFDNAMRTHTPGALPLVWFGLYRTPPRCIPREATTATNMPYKVGDWCPLVSSQNYRAAIERIRALIIAGDVYQVNYTFPLQTFFQGDALAWFNRLCLAQQTDYGAYINTGDHQLLSISPELFFRFDGTTLITRPMKGTARRGRWPEEDKQIAQTLAGSAKERAENVMIVDLLRNDMSRISAPNSVSARSLFDTERYPTVWQMTSTIESRATATVAGILSALFPSGSVTGAPKIRAMSIIKELEPYPRGAYCGAVGWLTPDGRSEFNVAIRTITIAAATGTAHYNVGGGITYGSDPEAEYGECLAKAMVLTQNDADFELLESLRLDENGFYLLPEHLQRLSASAEYCAFQFNHAEASAKLQAAAGNFCAGQAQKIRLYLRRDGRLRLDAQPLVLKKSPLRVGLSAGTVNENDWRLFHKTTNRAIYEAARAARPDCDDVLLQNRRGEITESTIANIVIIKNGRKLTPPLTCGLLNGVLRRHLLRQGEIQEQTLTRADFKRGMRFYLINSVRGWSEAQWID